jgi:hypothetical protein
MATSIQVSTLRRLIGDNDPTNYRFTDQDLSNTIDTAGSVNKAALFLWEAKSAESSELHNVSESGSTRAMGEVFKNAQAMAAYFKGKVDVETPPEPVRRGSVTRKIVRL